MIVRGALLFALTTAFSLMPLNLTGGTSASAAETGIPKIRLGSLKSIRQMLEDILRGGEIKIVLPKNPSPLARMISQRFEQINELTLDLQRGPDWMCKVTDYLEKYDKLRSSQTYYVLRDWANANGGNAFDAMILEGELDGLSDNAVREIVSAACMFHQ
jgi:hypothetical protein